MSDSSKQTHYFGHEAVGANEKTERVQAVFTSVADRYDIMNDLMSLTVHRHWKKTAIDFLRVQSHHRVLDCASGSGDLARLILKKKTLKHKLVCSDLNPSMLATGRERMLDDGLGEQAEWVVADATDMPFENNQFDRIIIGFGLRNITEMGNALKEFYRLLKPGGRLVVLEFSTPAEWMRPFYSVYLNQIVPAMGEFVAKDRASYQYLAESIERHPDQDTLAAMMRESGFDQVSYTDLTGGVAAIHVGEKD